MTLLQKILFLFFCHAYTPINSLKTWKLVFDNRPHSKQNHSCSECNKIILQPSYFCFHIYTFSFRTQSAASLRLRLQTAKAARFCQIPSLSLEFRFGQTSETVCNRHTSRTACIFSCLAYTSAMTSTSTRTPFGSSFAATHERAGLPEKYFP